VPVFLKTLLLGPNKLEDFCLVLCATACLLLIIVQSILSFDPNRSLWDFGSLYASATKANLHTNPYSEDPLVFRVREFDHYGPETTLQGRNVTAINLNPPVLLYPFRLLAKLPPRTVSMPGRHCPWPFSSHL